MPDGQCLTILRCGGNGLAVWIQAIDGLEPVIYNIYGALHVSLLSTALKNTTLDSILSIKSWKETYCRQLHKCTPASENIQVLQYLLKAVTMNQAI